MKELLEEHGKLSKDVSRVIKRDWESSNFSSPSIKSLSTEEIDMSNVAQMSEHKKFADTQFEVSIAIAQVKGVLVSLASDDNFETLFKEDLAGCLGLAINRLEDISRMVNQ